MPVAISDRPLPSRSSVHAIEVSPVRRSSVACLPCSMTRFLADREAVLHLLVPGLLVQAFARAI